MSWGRFFRALILSMAVLLSCYLVFYAIARFIPGPCDKPIKYSIGQLDSQFGISREEMISDMETASDLWNNAYGIELLKYSDDGAMKVNLIYDYRQETTDKIGGIASSISETNASYESIKKQYDSAVSQYNALKDQLSSMTSSYSNALAAYNNEVTQYNNKKSSSKEEYNNLTSQRRELESELSRINSLQSQANILVASINQMAKQLNSLAEQMNGSADSYNNINKSLDSQFEEGDYVYDNGKKEINVYQFDDKEKLIRVLAHEFGHSLGLGHFDNPDDIMYGLNISKSVTVTKEDIAALQSICSENQWGLFKSKIETLFGF
jgi:phage-related tail protein